jgi:arabinan endo-1,5-alpha-L-arabinosidase
MTSQTLFRDLIALGSLVISAVVASAATTHRSEIRIRDPFVLPDPETRTYLIYGTTTSGIFDGGVERKAVVVFRTSDLENWESPVSVWDVPADHWGRETVWAPEVHRYEGRYYLFVTITSTETLPTPAGRPQNVQRGTEILVADSPLGPFRSFGKGAQTPHEWMALDGSLWIEDGVPYMVFCHEWAQITDGSFDLVRLSPDLSAPVGEPELLFHASAGPWVRCRGDIGELYQGKRYHAYVSDGNWLHRTKTGELLMLWSSYGPQKYAVGIARSSTGHVRGPWEQQAEPLWLDDGGHPMLFHTFDGRLLMVIHQPNRRVERARFFEIEDLGHTLRIKGEVTRVGANSPGEQ